MLKLLTTFLLTLIGTSTLAQNADTFSISGRAVSANSGKPIIAGSIMIDENIGTTCDTTGQFLISGLHRGKHKLSFRCLDYDKKDTVITIANQNIKNLILTVPAKCKSYNRQKAIQDIRRGKAILFVDTKASQSDPTSNKQFKNKYGVSFEFNDFGLPDQDCMMIYNQTIFEHLDSRFGKQWREELKVNTVGFR